MKKVMKMLVWSYLGILIPMYLFSAFSTYYIINKSNKAFCQNAEDWLREIGGEIEQLFSEYEQSAILIKESYHQIKPEYILSDPIATRHALDVLKDISVLRPNVDDIFMTYGDGRIYSAKGVSKDKVYFSGSLVCSDENTIDACEFVVSPTQGMAYYEATVGDFILFHYPMQYYDTKKKVYINFRVNFSRMEDLFSGLTDNINYYISFAMGNQVKVMYDVTTSGESQKVLPNSIKKGDENVRWDSPSQDLTLEVYYNKADLYKQLFKNNVLHMLFLTFCIFFSGGLFYYSYQGGKKKLYTFAKNISDRSISKDGFWGAIGEQIGEIINESEYWKDYAAETKVELHNQIIHQVLRGQYKERSEIESMLNICGLELFEEYYFFIGIMLEEQERFLDQLRAKKPDTIFCPISVEEKSFIMVLEELPGYDPTYNLRSDIVEKYRQIANELGIEKIGFSISQVHQDVCMMGYAFSEVIVTFEKMGENFEGKKLYWEKLIVKSGIVLSIDKCEMDEYIKLLEEKNLNGIISQIKRILRFIDVSTCSENNKSYLYYCLLQPLITRMSENENGNAMLKKAIESLEKGKEEYEKELYNIISAYCKSDKQDFTEVINYVDANYMRYDLSLEEVAEYFGLTKTYLSKLFKNKIGMCYIDYLSEIRMKKAMQLLQETDLSIKEIVKNVGYLDVPTFRRKFKNKYGYSPSLVRGECKNNNKNV